MSCVIITGGATGIGAAAVRKFADEGYDVAVLDVNVEAATELTKEQHKGSITFIQADVSSKKGIKDAVDQAVEKLGPPSILFANAGIQKLSSLFDLKEEDVDAIINVNLKGAIYTVLAVALHMREQKSGNIILMASDQAFVGKEGSIVYGATKGAVAQLTKSFSVELSPLGIRVNAVCPATVKTPLTDGVFRFLADKHFNGDIDAAWAAEAQTLPIGRVAHPSEIADVVYFLSQPTSSFMTGALVPVDGGLTAQ